MYDVGAPVEPPVGTMTQRQLCEGCGKFYLMMLVPGEKRQRPHLCPKCRDKGKE